MLQAASNFAQGQVQAMTDDERDDACEGPDRGEETDTHEEREGEDYLGVHAGPAQFCYDGDPAVHTDGAECDTHPHGEPEKK